MSSKNIYLAATTTAILIFGTAYYFIAVHDKGNAMQPSGDIKLNLSPSQLSGTAVQARDMKDWQRFSNESPAFSLSYPQDIKIGKFNDADGETVLFQSDAKTVMQIYVAPFSEKPYVDLESIKADLPDLHMQEPQQVQITAGSGITFLSDNNLSEPTREIWFVRDGNLYQVSITIGNEQLAAAIIESMKFDSK